MKKIFFVLTLVALSVGLSNAQPLNRSTPEANLKSAKEAEATNNPYEALNLYQKVYADNNKDKTIAAKIAQLEYVVRDYEKAEKGFTKLVSRDRKGEFTELKYLLAMSMKANAKYADAIDMFNQYITDGADAELKKSAKLQIAGCELARKAKQPDNLLVGNIGKKANSPQTEASPSYSGGELYYASMQAKDIIAIDGKEGDWYAKIYTTAPGKEEFSEPKPLGTQINREDWHQGNVSVTPDGKTMYFTRVQLENNGLKESKILYSKKGADGWGAANEVTGVNGEFIAKHPCEGELFGEKVLFFVSNMPGTKGGFDIFYATKKGDGQFSAPVNLGEVINTPGEEASPFYRDGKLFFSSNGHPSLGGMDIFESQWNGSIWSAPKGLPFGINTSLDDQYYTQNADGLSGFYVSNRPGPNNLKSKTCCDDIYAWGYERVKVELLATTFRYKKKTEKENPALTGSTVQIMDVTDQNPANVEERTNATANDFSFTLAPEKSYIIIATHEGYVPDTLKFNTVGVKKSAKVDKKLTLRAEKPKEYVVIDTIRTNSPIRMNNIFYDYNKSNIRTDAEPDLQFLVDLLNKYPDMKIELSSHTDARGKDDYNMDLSQKRAESARNWIIAKGISGDRIVPKGYGETQLLNACTNGVECTEEQHQLNRRTEFKILSGPTTITVERTEMRKVTGEKAPEKPKGKAPGGKQSTRPVFFYLD